MNYSDLVARVAKRSAIAGASEVLWGEPADAPPSRQSHSVWADERSIVSFMPGLYRAGPCPTLRFSGPALAALAPAAERDR